MGNPWITWYDVPDILQSQEPGIIGVESEDRLGWMGRCTVIESWYDILQQEVQLTILIESLKGMNVSNTGIRREEPIDTGNYQQARAAGTYFASTSTQFSAMYLSDLKRAHSTGMAIHESQRDPKPRITVSELLREQHWGEAEGKPWSMKGDDNISREELYKKGVYPVIYDRVNKFPGGESLNDLQARAEIAINNFVMPHVWELAKTGKPERIALVSHGLCISELIAALVRRDHRASPDSAGKRWTGLLNTAWSRVEISIPVGLNWMVAGWANVWDQSTRRP